MKIGAGSLALLERRSNDPEAVVHIHPNPLCASSSVGRV